MGLGKSQGDWDGVRKAVDTRLAPVECLKKLPSPHTMACLQTASKNFNVNNLQAFFSDSRRAALFLNGYCLKLRDMPVAEEGLIDSASSKTLPANHSLPVDNLTAIANRQEKEQLLRHRSRSSQLRLI
ncbi:hypothetical protein KXV92_002327 [Aspergillus fumigatus]|nr:hypothetical protein KXX42_006701 [Aspergillus fumigatus]KAH1557502.1 hypothetical protein KXX57_005478 [Aspergillus fumigatus]KAH1984020.1 hypothetical protein KXW88_002508 [Aspergillus fumigatus]KAH2320628.1 hypothetical protein KXV47_000164 [Aspergillus fumigatus]KAH2675577.1 hypothetical protein KXV32_003642 [Aspergillus fumigatus]